jgi:hypothetical protein
MTRPSRRWVDCSTTKDTKNTKFFKVDCFVPFVCFVVKFFDNDARQTAGIQKFAGV